MKVNLPGRSALSFGIGFFIAFNIILLPFFKSSPRMIDLLGVISFFIFTCFLIVKPIFKKNQIIRVLIALILSLFWFAIEFYTVNIGGLIDSARWIVSLFLVYILYNYLGEYRIEFFKGVILGSSLHVIVLLVQFFGFLEITQMIGLSPADSKSEVFFAGIWRPPGMYSHPNGSAGSISLVIPIIIGLIDEKRVPVKWIFLAIGLVILSTVFTINRASFIVSFVSLGIWFAIHFKHKIVYIFTLIFCLFVLLISLEVEPPGGWGRWTSKKSLSRNANIRFTTTANSFLMSLKNPIGQGSNYDSALRIVAGSGSTHNAFIQIGLTAGLLLLAFVLGIFFKWILCHFFLMRSIESWIAIHLFGLFFFEEFFNSPMILFMLAIIIVVPAKYQTSQ